MTLVIFNEIDFFKFFLKISPVIYRYQWSSYFRVMLLDNVYHGERNMLRKTALLLTIPCAIFPILLAVFGMMQPAGYPLFFSYDRLFFGAIYLTYGLGLYFSFLRHRRFYPFLVFGLHVGSLVSLHKYPAEQWLAYVVLLSIIFTSLVNQYYRVGVVYCGEDCELEKL